MNFLNDADSFDFTDAGSSTGGAGGAGKVKFDRLSIKKYSDKATTQDFVDEIAGPEDPDELEALLLPAVQKVREAATADDYGREEVDVADIAVEIHFDLWDGLLG